MDLTVCFSVVKPPDGERRLVLQATTKSVRAQLIGAIRKANGHIKAYPALTPWERSNKRLVYKYANRRNLVVMDNGDRCYIRKKGAPTPPRLPPIVLDATPDAVLHSLENAFWELRQPTGPPPKRTTTFPKRPRGYIQPRSWVEAVAPRQQQANQGVQGVEGAANRPNPPAPPSRQLPPLVNRLESYDAALPPPTQAPNMVGTMSQPQADITAAEGQMVRAFLQALRAPGRVPRQQYVSTQPVNAGYNVAATAQLSQLVGVPPPGHGQAL